MNNQSAIGDQRVASSQSVGFCERRTSSWHSVRVATFSRSKAPVEPNSHRALANCCLSSLPPTTTLATTTAMPADADCRLPSANERARKRERERRPQTPAHLALELNRPLFVRRPEWPLRIHNLKMHCTRLQACHRRLITSLARAPRQRKPFAASLSNLLALRLTTACLAKWFSYSPSASIRSIAKHMESTSCELARLKHKEQHWQPFGAGRLVLLLLLLLFAAVAACSSRTQSRSPSSSSPLAPTCRSLAALSPPLGRHFSHLPATGSSSERTIISRWLA